MRRRWARLAMMSAYTVGVINLALVITGESSPVTLSLALVLTPFTLAMALKLTAFLACTTVSLALGDPRERTELLVCAIGGVQPPSEGERYREAMLGEIRAEPSSVRVLARNLAVNAPRTVLEAWGRIMRPRWMRARGAVGLTREASQNVNLLGP